MKINGEWRCQEISPDSSFKKKINKTVKNFNISVNFPDTNMVEYIINYAIRKKNSNGGK